MAGESLNRPDESKLSSVRFLLSPMVVLRTPAPIKNGVPRGEFSGCETPVQRFSAVGKCTHQLLPTAACGGLQPSSPWHADRRSAQGVRSTTEGEIFKGTDGACADPDTRIFPATGMAGGQGHSQLKTINFFVTYRFFVTFFTEESNVPRFPFSRSLVPLFPIPSSQKAAPGSSIRRRCKSL